MSGLKGAGGKVSGLFKDRKFQLAALAGAGLAGVAILRKRGGLGRGSSSSGGTSAPGTAGGVGSPSGYDDNGTGAYLNLQNEIDHFGEQLGTVQDQLADMKQGPKATPAPPKPAPPSAKKPPAPKKPPKKPAPKKPPAPPKHAPAPKPGPHRPTPTPPHVVAPPKKPAPKPAPKRR